MHPDVKLRVLAPLALLFAGALSAQCGGALPQWAGELAPQWAFIEQAYEEQEASRLADVTSRIEMLMPSAVTHEASTERIALVVALMDLQATLEWIAVRSAVDPAKVPAYVYEYRNAHPHRGLQRSLVRTALEMHPGDRWLVQSMVSLQGFDADFYGAQLEQAVAIDPTALNLRETLILMRLQSDNFEAARPHILEVLRAKPFCDEGPPLDIAMEAVGWLHANERRCPELRAKLVELERRALQTTAVGNDDGVGVRTFSVSEVANALRTSHDKVGPFLETLAHLLSTHTCR